jgi:ubiquinone/menaquinone biosynthesis C-methylase UbiE
MKTGSEHIQILPEVMAFYNEGKEASRLLQGLGRMEFARMQEILPRYLPPPPAVIADVGGGPGAYACWLAESGYAVHLVDPVPLHVEQAEQASGRQPEHPLASCRIGDARGLPLPDSSVDAVLLHGPLYHLTVRDDRLLALREARRILRPGGVLLAVAITAYASTIVGLVHGWVWDQEYLAMIREEIETGQHRRPPSWQVLTTAYFHHPANLAREVAEAGLRHEVVIGIQGPGWLAPDFEQSWQDESKRETLMRIARLVEHEPAHSPHMLAVAHKPREGAAACGAAGSPDRT